MITAIVNRLKDHAAALTSVEAAEELDALGKGVAPPNGASFVLPFGETALPNSRMTGPVLQEVDTDILIAFVVRRHGNAKGGGRVTDFDLFKPSIEAAILGWSISPEWAPFQLVAGKAGPLGNGATIYVQTWRTRRYLEEQS